FFVPITDDRPYLAGNVRYILSIRQVGTLFALAGGALAVVGGGTWLTLRPRGDPRIPRRPYSPVGGLPILFGATFLPVEHSVVVALVRRAFVCGDALAVAVVSFLCLAGLGSVAGSRMPKRWLLPLAVGGFAVLVVWGHQLPISGVLVAAAPVALATGTFFPAL